MLMFTFLPQKEMAYLINIMARKNIISVMECYLKRYGVTLRSCSTKTRGDQSNDTSANFETVFSFPDIKYVAVINRLKLYHILGTTMAIPSSGVLEMMDVVSTGTWLATCYVGFTGAAVLLLATLPFKNMIGHLYVSQDNTKIMISSMDFWGRRNDRIVTVDEWVPLLDMKSKTSDAFYLSPQLTDGTTYKLPIKLGKVLNAYKMGQVLE